MKVLIAGGGIGGLTAALCCLHFGHDVTVFEQAAKLGEVGAGIQIPPNAMKVFKALKIELLIKENAFQPQSIEAKMGETGRNIFTIPLASHAVDVWGAPYLHIHRADYIHALRKALTARAPNAIHLDVAVTHYDHTETGVTVTLSNGQKFTGDILIGADGIRSVIREQMLGPDTPVFTGNVAWRAVVPMDKLGAHAPNPTACVWMGKGRHCVTYRLRRGELANFVGVVERDDWTEESWATQGEPKDALNDFADWHPTITTLIQNIDPGSLFRWALFDRAPLSKWVDGNVALLGDAAHPMLPFLAQGAAMAVEDAWTLAHGISQDIRLAHNALTDYQIKRFERTKKTQAGSRANMKTFHKRTTLSQLSTYAPMWLAGKLMPKIVHTRMDWLYGYDVTQDRR